MGDPGRRSDDEAATGVPAGLGWHAARLTELEVLDHPTDVVIEGGIVNGDDGCLKLEVGWRCPIRLGPPLSAVVIRMPLC